MNGRYLRELSLDDLTARLEALTGRAGLRDAVAITQEKISTLDEFWPLARFVLRRSRWTTPRRARSSSARNAAPSALAAARAALADWTEPWTPRTVEAALRQARRARRA